jgi:thiamine kinase-like enzyme
MVEKLSPDSRHRLNQALSTWRDWKLTPESEPGLIEKLGGHTNESYRVSDSVNDWVVRLNSTTLDAGINRKNELLAIEAAHGVGIAPGIAYHDQDLLVLPFLHGSRPTLEDLPAIGRMFHKIHSLAVDAEPIDLHKHLRSYHQAATPDSDISNCLAKFHKIEHPAQTSNVLCHQDLTLDNLIKGGVDPCIRGEDVSSRDGMIEDNQILVIDWEYAHYSDPAYDLAVFIYTSKLTEAQKTMLLVNYARDERNLRQRIHYYELFYGMLEILWWHNRGEKNEVQIFTLNRLIDQVFSG